MNQQGITAVILAAGYSTRMGQFKPLLKIGDQTMIERSVSLFRHAGIDDIRVVIGHCREQMEPVLEKIGIRTIINDANTHEMFSSLLAALENLESHIQAIILLPVDIPLVRPWTIRYLLNNIARTAIRF
jgi:molybdenum cofactor cytidylyltransferase